MGFVEKTRFQEIVCSDPQIFIRFFNAYSLVSLCFLNATNDVVKSLAKFWSKKHKALKRKWKEVKGKKLIKDRNARLDVTNRLMLWYCSEPFT